MPSLNSRVVHDAHCLMQMTLKDSSGEQIIQISLVTQVLHASDALQKSYNCSRLCLNLSMLLFQHAVMSDMLTGHADRAEGK